MALLAKSGRCSNPFFHRGPIVDRSYFWDRRQESTETLGFLKARQSVALMGPRGIGRTSLLLYLLDRETLLAEGLDPESFLFAYLIPGTNPEFLACAFYSFFAQEKVGVFDRQSSRDLLAELAARAGCSFHPKTVEFTLSLSGPHPLLLQVAGFHAFAQGAANGAPIDHEMAERARAAFLAEAEALWNHYWRTLTEAQQWLLALLPASAEAAPEEIGRMIIRVLIVDPRPIVRHGVRTYLSVSSGVEVVGEAASGKEAVRMAEQLRPDVIVMEVAMAGMDGMTVIGVLRKCQPEVRILVFTSADPDEVLRAAMAAGASALIPGDAELHELGLAIQYIVSGQRYVSQKLAGQLVDRVSEAPMGSSLTEREEQVLQLLAQGYSNKEIAALMRIGVTTVKTHVRSILGKLGVSSRTQAAIRATERGGGPGGWRMPLR